MTKVDQIYRRLEQESEKLDESIEIVKISLGEDYYIYQDLRIDSSQNS